MIAAVVKSYLGVTVPLVVGCCVVYFSLAGWSWAPVSLVCLMTAMLLVGQWVQAAVERRPLGEEHAELQGAVETMAELAGVRLRSIGVAADEPPPVGGEVVFAARDVAQQGLSLLLAKAAKQLAAMIAPPLFTIPGLLVTGAATGAVLVVYRRLGSGLAASLAAIALAAVLAVVVAWRLSAAAAEREQRVEAGAREILGAMRDGHPEAFADLAARQGLVGPPGRSPLRNRDGPPS